MINQSLFSSDKTTWETPKAFFEEWNKKYNFTLDVCASSANAKCSKYFTEADDALKQNWGNNICWMNPPYGKTIGKWVKKAYDSAQKDGATVCCLLPSRTDTKWFHEFCLKGEIHFVKGRLKFVGADSSAPFPSVIVIFKPTSK